MKTKKIFGLLSCLLVFSSCQKTINRDYGLLKEPDEKRTITNNERNNEKYRDYLKKYQNFAAKLSFESQKYFSREENFLLSPLSTFMCLTIASEISASKTREEILNALTMNYDEVHSFTNSLINQSCFKNNTAMLDITNSLWLNSSFDAYSNVLDILASEYYCYSYKMDFLNDNKKANETIKNFIKDKTRNLIEWDKNYDENTIFTLINTLYLKDIWSIKYDEISSKNATFLNCDNTSKECEFLIGNYIKGRIYHGDNYDHFYTKLNSGFKIKFILPHENVDLKDVFNEKKH